MPKEMAGTFGPAFVNHGAPPHHEHLLYLTLWVQIGSLGSRTGLNSDCVAANHRDSFEYMSNGTSYMPCKSVTVMLLF